MEDEPEESFDTERKSSDLTAGEERGRRHRELDDLLKEHPARSHHERWQAVRMVHAALEWNEYELLEVIDFSSERGQMRALAIIRDDEELNIFWLHLFQRLANFTAMNQTLIDYVRNMMQSYARTDFARAEELRRRDLADAPATRFLKDLRNYTTHHTAPPMQFQMHFTPNSASYDAQLDVKQLAVWDKWSAGGRAYFAGRTELSITEPVKEYRKLRAVYYDWLFSQFGLRHGDEMRAYDEMVSEQQRIRAEAEAEQS